MKVLRISFLSGFVLELAASLSVAIVAVQIGLRLLDGSLALSVGLFVLLLAPEAFLPVRGVGVQFHAAADGLAAADDVLGILDEADAARRRRPGEPASAAADPATGRRVRRPGADSRLGHRATVGCPHDDGSAVLDEFSATVVEPEPSPSSPARAASASRRC